MTFLFESLEVYQKALSLADRVPELTAHCGRRYWYLADQLNRASLSIALNLAEGNGRGTAADKRRFFFMARGSVLECAPLTELCRRKELLPPETCTELRTELVNISKMLSGLIDRLSAPDSVREEEVGYA